MDARGRRLDDETVGVTLDKLVVEMETSLQEGKSHEME